jgi:uncharacterized zinc-type alcohol dehydrogenase-like protein
MPRTAAYAAKSVGAKFEKQDIELPELGTQDVEIAVESCGVCHSDLSMLHNEWGFTQYPFVGGHEVIGRVSAIGSEVPNLKVGELVGLGWNSRSCMHCNQCITGNQNLCPEAKGTITHQAGGFADRVRCHWAWTLKIPENLNATNIGPFLCGGITVFNPLIQHGISPLARVAVVGIGGLGHMALMFANAWGCEVTAISRSRAKESEARELGAHHYIATEESDALKKAGSQFDLIINTINVPLPWDDYIAALAPKGILHTVGAAPKIEATLIPMIFGQKTLAASPTGPIGNMRHMLDFASRHQLEPVTEVYSFSEINEAFEKLSHGSPRYRLVLVNR